MRLKRLKERQKESYLDEIEPELIDSEVDKIERVEKIELGDPRFLALNFGAEGTVTKRPKSSNVTSPR